MKDQKIVFATNQVPEVNLCNLIENNVDVRKALAGSLYGIARDKGTAPNLDGLRLRRGFTTAEKKEMWGAMYNLSVTSVADCADAIGAVRMLDVTNAMELKFGYPKTRVIGVIEGNEAVPTALSVELKAGSPLRFTIGDGTALEQVYRQAGIELHHVDPTAAAFKLELNDHRHVSPHTSKVADVAYATIIKPYYKR
jgi:hypothetical protein